MTQGIKISLVLFVGIGLIFLIVYFFFFSSENSSQKNIPADQEQNEKLPPETSSKIIRGNDQGILPSLEVVSSQPSRIVSDEEREIGELSSFVFSFTERFGSYSEESQSRNFRDLKIFMTDSMAEWSDTLTASAIDGQFGKTYNRVSTKALVLQEFSMDKEKRNAVFLVTTQRRVSLDDGEEKVFSQDVQIELIKNAKEDWKVNALYWK